MTRYACPICHDPQAYVLWVDKTPPEGCPEDMAWQHGKPISIRNVTECKFQMARAWQEAEFRKLVPDAFDRTGKIKPGRIVEVLMRFAEVHPAKGLTI